MFIRKVKKESKLLTGFPTLHMRLPSLCMQALGLGYSTVWANRAGGQSTFRLWLKTSPQGGTAFPVKHKTLLNLLYSISLDSDHTRVGNMPTRVRGHMTYLTVLRRFLSARHAAIAGVSP